MQRESHGCLQTGLDTIDIKQQGLWSRTPSCRMSLPLELAPLLWLWDSRPPSRLLSTPPSLPNPHPPSSLLLATKPHLKPLVITHHPECFILPNSSWTSHLLPRLPTNCLVPVFSSSAQTAPKPFGASFGHSQYVVCPSSAIFIIVFFVTTYLSYFGLFTYCR